MGYVGETDYSTKWGCNVNYAAPNAPRNLHLPRHHQLPRLHAGSGLEAGDVDAVGDQDIVVCGSLHRLRAHHTTSANATYRSTGRRCGGLATICCSRRPIMPRGIGGMTSGVVEHSQHTPTDLDRSRTLRRCISAGVKPPICGEVYYFN